jgi:asparagine synthase (glutamine-hydrolysing)
MCGIAGYLGPERFDGQRLERSLAHRGPNGHGHWSAETGAGRGVHLVHTRLSILDLSNAAAQPMRDAESGSAIAFNGEIFNYRTLRAGLGGQAAFTSTGDTEVLLRGLAARGPGFFAELDGMFAVLLYEPGARRLIVARDPLGIKPLYYSRTRAGGWIFASEVRAILQSGVWAGGLHADGVLDYLRFGCLQEPDTLFAGIHAFPAGHWGVVSVDAPERMRTESFWPIEKIMRTPPPSGDVAAWHDEVWHETMKEHLEADVKTGVFLSAGMDSTAILEAIPKADRERVTAFTLAGELTSTDEGALAATTAANLGVSHQIVRLSEAEVLAWVRDGFDAMDQPSGDGVNTYLVSRASKAARLTVALGGTGADELHGAYGHAESLPKLARVMAAAGPFAGMLQWGAVRGFEAMRGAVAAERLDLMLDEAPSLWRMTYEKRRFYTQTQIQGLWPEAAGLVESWRVPSDWPGEFARLDPFNEVTLAELKGYMRNMLLRDADWATMANQQELRVPFLGKKYVECVLRIAPAQRHPGKGAKKPLIAAGISAVNREIIRRPKTGFNLTCGQMLLGPLRDQFHAASATLNGRLGFTLDAEQSLTQLSATRSPRDAFRLWSLMSLGLYVQRHASDTGDIVTG